MLPVPSDLTDAIEVTVSAWAEKLMLVDTPVKAMGCIMRLSSALGYSLVRLALDGDLSEYALRCVLQLPAYSSCMLIIYGHCSQDGTHMYACAGSLILHEQNCAVLKALSTSVSYFAP